SAATSSTPSLSASAIRSMSSFVSQMVLIVFSSSSGRCDARSAPLEALDATSLRDRAFDARVRGMTVRADLDGERDLHGSCGEFVPTGATAHVGRLEVRMVPLHVSNSSQVFRRR